MLCDLSTGVIGYNCDIVRIDNIYILPSYLFYKFYHFIYAHIVLLSIYQGWLVVSVNISYVKLSGKRD